MAAGPTDAASIQNAAGPSLVIGADGFGLVAYQNRSTLDLEVAHCVDAVCSAVTISTVDSAGDVGARPAMVLGPGGLPLVSYLDLTNEDLKLAFCADAACGSASTVVVDPELGSASAGATAIAIGGDGRPLIAYAAGPFDPTPPFNLLLRVAHCESAGCTSATISEVSGANGASVDLDIAGDGRGVVAATRSVGLGSSTVDFHHCDNLACTSVTPGAAATVEDVHPSLDVGPDGLPIYSYVRFGTMAPTIALHIRRCLEHSCTTFTDQAIPEGGGGTSLAITSAGVPRVAASIRLPSHDELRLYECNDAGCTAHQKACFAPWGDTPSLALDGSDQPLVAYERGGRVEIGRPSSPCAPTFTTADAETVENGPPAPASITFMIRLGPPATTPLTVAYTTVDGTAQAGVDYVAQSGLLTFAPGESAKAQQVWIVPDSIDEPDETLDLVLTAPRGTPFAQGRAVGTIRDDDPPVLPTISVQDCIVTEGNAGSVICPFQVALTGPFSQPVTVDYATADGTATAGDYVPQDGTLIFAPGTTLQTVSVSVVGDLAGEADEFFSLLLASPVNAMPGDMNATGTILDDDWPVLPGTELSHGSAVLGDFQPDPGPTPDRDDYRIALAPFASYEVLLDAVSGDAAPDVRLERVATDGTTVLDVGAPVGTGSALSVRFVNSLPVTVTTTYLRVRDASCGTGCGPEDTYRIRVYETTGRIPRFNNSGSQTTILILQNTTDRAVLADAHFWNASGTHLAAQGALLAPHATSVISSASLPNLAGASGSITVTHYGPHGAIAGKAVALEPSTGFSFDSPMVLKPR